MTHTDAAPGRPGTADVQGTEALRRGPGAKRAAAPPPDARAGRTARRRCRGEMLE